MKTSTIKQSFGASSSASTTPQPRSENARSDEARDIREEVGHEEIARRAHELWEQEGRPDGRSEQHWREAEGQLRGSSFQQQQEVDAREQAQAIKASAERRSSGSSRN